MISSIQSFSVNCILTPTTAPHAMPTSASMINCVQLPVAHSKVMPVAVGNDPTLKVGKCII